MSEGNKPIIIVDGQPQQVDAILSVEAKQQCDDCGAIAELRPYGKGGATVCFDCMMKDEAEGQRQMSKHMGWDEGDSDE